MGDRGHKRTAAELDPLQAGDDGPLDGEDDAGAAAPPYKVVATAPEPAVRPEASAVPPTVPGGKEDSVADAPPVLRRIVGRLKESAKYLRLAVQKNNGQWPPGFQVTTTKMNNSAHRVHMTFEPWYHEMRYAVFQGIIEEVENVAAHYLTRAYMTTRHPTTGKYEATTSLHIELCDTRPLPKAGDDAQVTFGRPSPPHTLKSDDAQIAVFVNKKDKLAAETVVRLVRQFCPGSQQPHLEILNFGEDKTKVELRFSHWQGLFDYRLMCAIVRLNDEVHNQLDISNLMYVYSANDRDRYLRVVFARAETTRTFFVTHVDNGDGLVCEDPYPVTSAGFNWNAVLNPTPRRVPAAARAHARM